MNDYTAPWNPALGGPPEESAVAISYRDIASASWEDDLAPLLTGPSDETLDWILVLISGNEAVSDASFAAPMVTTTNADLRSRLVLVGAAGTNLNELSCFSGRGTQEHPLDLVAPGGDQGCSDLYGTGITTLQGYSGRTEQSGTSFAAPLVTGSLALAWSLMPTWTAAEVRQAILDGADTAPDGIPRLNLAGAVQAAVQACTNAGGVIDPITKACNTECVPDCVGIVCGDMDGCGGYCHGPELRRCQGDTIISCNESGTEDSWDCAATGKICALDPAQGVLRCVEPAAVDNPPTGTILSPVEWTTLSADFAVNVQVSDDIGLERITVQVGDVGGLLFTESVDVSVLSTTWTTSLIDTSSWTTGNYYIALWLADGLNAIEADVIGILFSE